MVNRLTKWGLGGLLGVALAIASSSVTKEVPIVRSQTETILSKVSESIPCTETIMDQFPESIPGAVEVKKYPVHGASHCLVHILQHHLGSYGNEMPAPNSIEYSHIVNVQEGIYQILTNLVEKLQIKKVYYEGNANPSKDFLTAVRNSAKLAEKGIEEYARDNYADEAVLRMGITKDIPVGLTESQEAIKEGHAFIDNKKNWTYKNFCKTIMDDREDGVLETLAKDSQPLKVLVYGSSHRFGGTNSCGTSYRSEMEKDLTPGEKEIYQFDEDNISKWNTTHPKEKFSLIEIRPKGI